MSGMAQSPSLRTFLIALCVTALCAWGGRSTQAQSDLLPSWNDGATKQAIMTFVERVTKNGSPDYVSPTERIATFDNDGTLWACGYPWDR